MFFYDARKNHRDGDVVKRALITGVTGQDGSYLAEFLLQQGYEVFGLVRRSSQSSLQHITQLPLQLIEGDMLDEYSLQQALRNARPHEIYNLAAMSHVGASFALPGYAAEVNALGPLKLLQAMREIVPEARFYQASTSELFGNSPTLVQNEQTPFAPRSPYGISKLYAFWTVVNYREAFGLYACNGILFNHESPRRGAAFVSRKITTAAANISLGLQEVLVLGNLEARRDWGYAEDFIYGMWLMLQQKTPRDFVLATGKAHTVRDLVTIAFAEVGLSLRWEGRGLEEKGIDQESGRVLVEVSKDWFRPAEVDTLLGDASLALQELGWKPKTSFEDMVSLMVKQDLEMACEKQALHRC